MDLNDSITYQITKCGNILRQLTAKRIKAVDINVTPEESVLLNQLWDKDTQTQSELGEWAVKGPSTVTRQIDSLVKKGYVQRVHSSEDRRKIYAKLTAKGKKLRQLFEATGISQLDSSLQGISTEDLETTFRVLLRIKAQALDELKDGNF